MKCISTSLILILLLAGCGGKTVRWKQEVLLHDGEVVVMDRISERSAVIFPENVSMEKMQEISFKNPKTGEKVFWDVPGGLKPYSLEFENSMPYMLLTAYTVADYNRWGCPNPPYLVYGYENKKWEKFSFEDKKTYFLGEI